MNKKLIKQLMNNIKTDVENATDLVSPVNSLEAKQIRDKILSTLKSLGEVINKMES